MKLARTALLVLATTLLAALATSPALAKSPPRQMAELCAKKAPNASPRVHRAAVNRCLKGVQRTAKTSRDTTAPTVAWKLPTAGATVKGKIQLAACEASASDNRSVSRVVFKVDGTTLNNESDAPWNCSFDSTKVNDGSHTLTATAYDSAGNSRSSSTTVNVANTAVSSPAPTPEPAPEPKPTPTPEPTPTPAPEPTPTDTAAPTASWKVPTAGATVSGKIQLSACEINASDASGIDSVVFKVDSTQLNTESDAPWNCNFDSTKVSNGTHTLTATAHDGAGNTRSITTTVNVSNTTTAPAPAPTPEPAPTPTPAPTPSLGGMIVGLDAGNYGSTGASDVRGAVNTVRYEADRGVSGLTAYENAGLKIQLNFAGPYNSGGVCALNASAWVSDTLNFYKTNTTPAQAPVIEVLNEPGGTWFWGSNAANSANATCYRNLLKATYNAFHAQYGEAAPKILGTLDGSGGLAFGKLWVTSDWATYVDGFIVHPYGGNSNKTTSAQGNKSLIESARAMTGGPIYITEVGWPTAVGQPVTGDSMQWTEAEQATNITNFIAWCKGTGYVAEVIYFNYRDYGSSMWYGVLRTDGSKKPAYTALKEAAAKYGA